MNGLKLQNGKYVADDIVDLSGDDAVVKRFPNGIPLGQYLGTCAPGEETFVITSHYTVTETFADNPYKVRIKEFVHDDWPDVIE